MSSVESLTDVVCLRLDIMCRPVRIRRRRPDPTLREALCRGYWMRLAPSRQPASTRDPMTWGANFSRWLWMLRVVKSKHHNAVAWNPNFYASALRQQPHRTACRPFAVPPATRRCSCLQRSKVILIVVSGKRGRIPLTLYPLSKQDRKVNRTVNSVCNTVMLP